TLNWWGSSTGPTIASNAGGTGELIIDMDGVVKYGPFLLTLSSCAPAPQIGPPTNKDQCKKDGWMNFNVPRKFKNQGDCVSYMSNGKSSLSGSERSAMSGRSFPIYGFKERVTENEICTLST